MSVPRQLIKNHLADKHLVDARFISRNLSTKPHQDTHKDVQHEGLVCDTQLNNTLPLR
jgi:hypothetical protein